MSETKAKKKYSLVVEPHGSYEKYVVYFDYDAKKGYQIKKQPFKTCSEIAKSKKGKCTLFELDVFTSEMFEDDYDLFKKLGLYQQVHNVYIQFTNSKGYLKRLPVIYDEDLVIDRLSNIKNGKIVDYSQMDEYIDMLINDKDFFRKYISSTIYKTSTVDVIVKDLRQSGVYVKQSGGSYDSNSWLLTNKQSLKEEMSKYHIYRGFVLAEAQATAEKKQKEELQSALEKKDEPKVYAKRKVYPGYEPQEYKQFKIDGFDDEN